MTKRRWLFITALALGALVVTAGVVVARGPGSPSGAPLAQSALGTGFTYQGRLDESGTPADGAFDLRFILFDADVGGAQVGGIVSLDEVAVDNGLFTVRLDFGDGVFTGDARWLEVAVRPGASVDAHTIMSPRQPLTPTPYALALPGFYTQPNPTSTNVIGGFSGNIVAAGVVGATISGGGAAVDPFFPANPGLNRVTANYGTVSGGRTNLASGSDSTIGGGDENTASGADSTISGGDNNTASGSDSTIGGGRNNITGGLLSVVGGGIGNTASDTHSTVGGGRLNTASEAAATVGGGEDNSAGDHSTVGGGLSNVAGTGAATIGGGEANSASATWATIGGGLGNTANGESATVGGGEGNSAGDLSTVGGGLSNVAGTGAATVAGGNLNVASGSGSSIGGGLFNVASGTRATIGGGSGNIASEPVATIGGGAGNSAGDHSTVGGGLANVAGTGAATVGGGEGNLATALWTTVGGGVDNAANATSSTVGGGQGNTASGPWATVGGGFSNAASGATSAIGGGHGNQATVDGATVGGGEGNTASGLRATVGGGLGNTASSIDDTVGGGQGNVASGGWATVGGGLLNQANGTRATIPGGDRNTANGHFSFAAGRRANADDQGSFVWADSNNLDFNSAAANEFAIRATGGVRLVTAIDGSGNRTAGCDLSTSGDLSCNSFIVTSDRNAKVNLTAVDGRAILERLTEIPIETWSYKTQDPSIRHIGPMAQDFHAAFGLGVDDRHIGTVDADGVALAAIQGLHDVVREKDATVASLQGQNRELLKRVEALEQAGTKGSTESHPLTASIPLPWVILVLGGFLAVAALLSRGLHMRRER